ncbi:hypothetical protein QR680_013069 [Steinernema hermaphroditum]|uniref:ZP domain-containing protein n=1 Tax=Steinernema hermaphroditum TaxID=289476 RepID=A0AA39I5V9_9BILA|nr:hypothetical protein QR680_013069 [Steinernema hermaphroditum]
MNPLLLCLLLLLGAPSEALIDVSYNILYLPMVVVRNRTCASALSLDVDGVLRIDANRSCIDSAGHSYILNQAGLPPLTDGGALEGFFSLNETSKVTGYNVTLSCEFPFKPLKVDKTVAITVFVAIRSIAKSTTVNFALGVLLGAIVVALFCAVAFCVRAWPNFSPLESSDSIDPLTEDGNLEAHD